MIHLISHIQPQVFHFIYMWPCRCGPHKIIVDQWLQESALLLERDIYCAVTQQWNHYHLGWWWRIHHCQEAVFIIHNERLCNPVLACVQRWPRILHQRLINWQLSEITVLEEIVDVEHVPTLTAGGDVLLPDGWQDNTMMHHPRIQNCNERVHRWLLMKEVCMPLSTFHLKKELVGVFIDVIKGRFLFSR